LTAPVSFKRLLDSSVIRTQSQNRGEDARPERNGEKERSVPPALGHLRTQRICGTLHLGADRKEEHDTGAEADNPGEDYNREVAKWSLHPSMLGCCLTDRA
jgi:hypothetical protein